MIYDVRVANIKDPAEPANCRPPQAKADKARDAKWQTRQAVLRGDLRRGVIRIEGKSIFCAAGCDVEAAHLRRRRLSRVGSRSRAQVFLVRDVGSPGQRILWVVALQGGAVIDPGFLRGGDGHGLVVTYSPAVSRCQRRVWCSQRFVDQHPTLYNLLDFAIQHAPNCRWTFLSGTVADFHRAASKRSAAICVALVTPRDKAESRELRRCAKAFVAHEFVNLFLQLVPARSSACGRPAGV